MHTKRKAFTIIELVFVIVILGILAAVAVPKLSATRDDAKITQIVNSVNVAMSEISAYILSQNSVEDDLSFMSNSLQKLKILDLVTIDTGARSASIKAGSINDCLTIQVLNSGGDENLTINLGAVGTDTICTGVQSKINTNGYSISIGGNIAKF